MITREELLKTEEYWFETIQNDIYRMVSEYKDSKGINQTDLANELGVSRGYISQIMNGNFNYTLKKLIEISLAVNKVPVIDFMNINQFIAEDKSSRFEISNNAHYALSRNEFGVEKLLPSHEYNHVSRYTFNIVSNANIITLKEVA